MKVLHEEEWDEDEDFKHMLREDLDPDTHSFEEIVSRSKRVVPARLLPRSTTGQRPLHEIREELLKKANPKVACSLGLSEIGKIQIKPFDLKNPEWIALEEQYRRASANGQQLEADALFTKCYGREGMRDSDLRNFEPFPAKYWTLRELKNRIKWLKGQRGTLLGKPDKIAALKGNAEKIARYTKELFKRYSAERLTVERMEHNRLRRSRRAIAKQRKIAAMMNKWFAERKTRRKAAKSLTGTEPQLS